MPRVLIVVSSYEPAMLADMQRARMLAWELPKLGWDVEILTPDSTEVRQDALESQPAGFFPNDTPVHKVRSVARSIFRILGSRSPAFRTLKTMEHLGSALLGSGRFNLVYFSTTTFSYFSLGPKWKRRTGVPYVLDFQDPWVKEKAGTKREGWKNRVLQYLFAAWEKSAISGASGLVSVSPDYIEALRRRYSVFRPVCLQQDRSVVVPFGAQPSDLANVEKDVRTIEPMSRAEILIHYTGVGGPVMARSFAEICRCLAVLVSEDPPLAKSVRIRLFGTAYPWKSGDPKTMETIAYDAGVGELVAEYPQRVSYRRSLELLLEGDGALILGVDDPAYMPSKLFTYALTGKPLLACLHHASQAADYFRQHPLLGHIIYFGEETQPANNVGELRQYLHESRQRLLLNRNEILMPFLSAAAARRHSDLFDRCSQDT